MSLRREGHGAAVGADSRVDDDEVQGSGGKAVPGSAEEVCTGADVARRDGVGDVHQRRTGSEREDDPLDLRDVRIGGAEIGQQSDEGHWVSRGTTP